MWRCHVIGVIFQLWNKLTLPRNAIKKHLVLPSKMAHFWNRIKSNNYSGFPIVSESNRLVGFITRHDLEKGMSQAKKMYSDTIQENFLPCPRIPCLRNVAIFVYSHLMTGQVKKYYEYVIDSITLYWFTVSRSWCGSPLAVRGNPKYRTPDI